MKQIILLLLFLTPSLYSNAQGFIREFGRISQSDIELAEVEFDRTAEAVVIFDKGESHFQRNGNGFHVIFERTTRIKIFNEAGIDYAQFEIPFYQEGSVYEKIYDLKGTTYNFEDGLLKKTVLNLENTYDEIYNESWMVKKFAMPNVRPGSIVEVSYKISSQYLFNLRDWDFQRSIPTLFSEYVTHMIPFYEYTFILQGKSRFDLSSSEVDRFGTDKVFGNVEYKDMIYRFAMMDVPAFIDEEFITSPNDFLVKMDFQLSKINYPNGTSTKIQTTWPAMIKDLQRAERFGKYIKKSEREAKKIFNISELMMMSEKEKFDTIVDLVKSDYSWNNVNGIYCRKDFKKFMNEKHGNVSNINLFLAGLLRAAGLDAYPVVLSTRSHGKIQYDYPFTSFLNYVIVAVNMNDKIILTDATEVMAPNNMIPPRCLNGRGLAINSKDEEWIRLVHKYPSRLETKMVITFSEDLDQIMAEIDIIAKEFDALRLRKRFAGDEEKLLELFSEEGNYNVDEILTIDNLNDPDKLFRSKYRASIENIVLNGKIYISPFLSETISDNPMKQKKRKLPVDMSYPKIRDFNSFIEIPEGYEVEYLPESKKISNDLFEFWYYANNEDGQVQVSFSYYFKKGIYSSKEYLRLKLWFDDIINKSNEKIVLLKKV